ncbi:hypothetical protein [Microbacterium sp. YY-01]|uniref:hypothetical protein n=1 Tax=Microbacterium sp. YY-01 TaxID=3421634 RepID=UPI003D168A84
MTRPSPAVYRRRRLVVFGGLVLAIALVVWGIWAVVASGSSHESKPTLSPQPSVSPTTAEPEVSPSSEVTDEATPDATTPPPLVACTAADVDVVAVTDADVYASDQKPQLSISITNRTQQDCTLNVGTAKQVFTVTSGADVWWRSTDCQTEPSDMIVTVKAGSTVSSAEPVVWDRTRSSVDTCDSDDRPRAAAGGASYHLTVEIGGLPPSDTVQFILQ